MADEIIGRITFKPMSPLTRSTKKRKETQSACNYPHYDKKYQLLKTTVRPEYRNTRRSK